MQRKITVLSIDDDPAELLCTINETLEAHGR